MSSRASAPVLEYTGGCLLRQRTPCSHYGQATGAFVRGCAGAPRCLLFLDAEQCSSFPGILGIAGTGGGLWCFLGIFALAPTADIDGTDLSVSGIGSGCQGSAAPASLPHSLLSAPSYGLSAYLGMEGERSVSTPFQSVLSGRQGRFYQGSSSQLLLSRCHGQSNSVLSVFYGSFLPASRRARAPSLPFMGTC